MHRKSTGTHQQQAWFGKSQSCKSRRAQWRNGWLFMLALLNLGLGTLNSVKLPSMAMKMGALPMILVNFVVFLFIARPLFCLEMFVSQYTTRDFIDVWKIRPFLSHIGYIILCWQFLMLICYQIISSFILQYLLLIFEKPIPFYYCGPKSTNSCGAFRQNLTVNEDCTRREKLEPYCKHLYESYTEYQFWAYDLMELNNPKAFVRWKIVLCSAIVSVIIYFCVFKRTKSLQRCVTFCAIYPLCGYFILSMGAMLQKGVVDKFEEVMDSRFDYFPNSKLSYMVVQAVYSLKVGTGLYPTLATTGYFRSPCQSNTTVVTIITWCFNTLAILTTGMFFCTYSYVNEVPAFFIIEQPISFLFVTVPRVLYDYRGRHLWLLLYFSSNLVLGVSSAALVFFCLMELAYSRYQVVAEYPGLFSLLGVLLVFLLSIPTMSNAGIDIVLESALDYSNIVTPALLSLQSVVFVISYGINNITGDIHFLSGDRPTFFTKIVFLFSTCFMFWATVSETAYCLRKMSSSLSKTISWGMVVLSFGAVFLGMLVKLSFGWWQQRLAEVVRIDPTWGPNSEISRRSRDMFSAQAVTKEYIYRQNQLQAGIQARQRRSNIRAPCYQTTRHFMNVTYE